MLRFRCSLVGLALIPVIALGVPVSAQSPSSEPDDPIEQALVAYDEGRLTEARSWFERAHARAPSARTLRGLGVTSFALGNFAQAARELEAALGAQTRALEGELRERTEVLLNEARNRIVEDTQVVAAPSFDESVDLVEGGEGAPSGGSGDAVGGREGEAVVPDAGLRATDALASPEVVVDDTETVPPTQARRHPRRRAGLATIAVSSGLLTASLVTYAIARARYSGILDECESGCTAERIEHLYARHDLFGLGRASITTLALGVTVGVVGTVLFVPTRHDRAMTAGLFLGPDRVLFRRVF